MFKDQLVRAIPAYLPDDGEMVVGEVLCARPSSGNPDYSIAVVRTKSGEFVAILSATEVARIAGKAGEVFIGGTPISATVTRFGEDGTRCSLRNCTKATKKRK